MNPSPDTPEFAIAITDDFTLDDLIQRIPSIDRLVQCRDLIGTFLRYETDTLVIAENEIPIGMVTHRKVADSLATQFGYALFEHRSVTELMATDFLVVESKTSILDSFGPALRRSKESLYNDIIVVEEGRYRGLLSIARLMVEQARRIRTQVEQLERARVMLMNTNAKLNQSTSDLRQTEAQLLQAEKMASIGTLAAGIAHDFNNMLGTVVAGAHMIRTTLSPEAPSLRYCEYIEKAAYRARDLTQQMLQFSQKNIVNLHPISINEIIDEAIKILSRTIGKNIEIRLELHDHLPPIIADETQIQQVIMNLALNARDAMADGGVLTIGSGVIQIDEEYCKRFSILHPGEHVLLQVSDSGCGISPEHLSKIFDPFFTTKGIGKGTGLGLSVVYGIITRHKGIIDVTSEIGLGTRFSLIFPRADEEAQISQKQLNVESPVHGTGRILICDDEESLLLVMGECLRSIGYETILVNNGTDADAIYKDKWQEIDLVLLDMAMPGIGGLETMRLLKQTNPRVPVVILTGYSDDDRLRQVMLEGALDVVRKPVDVANLSIRIKSAFDSTQTASTVSAGNGRDPQNTRPTLLTTSEMQ